MGTQDSEKVHVGGKEIMAAVAAVDLSQPHHVSDSIRQKKMLWFIVVMMVSGLIHVCIHTTFI